MKKTFGWLSQILQNGTTDILQDKKRRIPNPKGDSETTKAASSVSKEQAITWVSTQTGL